MSSTPAEGGRGVPSYKQLVAELETSKAKIKQLVSSAAAAKKAQEQAQVDAVEEARRTTKTECEAREADRIEREKAAEAARERARQEDAERLAKEAEATAVRRATEAVARVTALYDGKFAELRSELMVQQRSNEDLGETLRTLQEWQKSAQALESSWVEIRKEMEVEIAAGKKAAADLARYKTLLQFMTVHKFVKDVKLKKRLLPLHTSISKLIALILRDDDLRKRLINQQAELARWVEDAQSIERAEGIQSSGLPSIAAELGGASTGSKTNVSTGLAPMQRGFMVSTNVDYLVASLIEVEHVLHTCVGTVLRYSAHFKTTSAGFFERNSALTAYAMAVEKECRDTKARAARTASQLASTLGLLARLEVKYSQVSRKLGKEDRVVAQRYLSRHGISSVAMAAADEVNGGTAELGSSTTGSVTTLLALPPGRTASTVASSTSSEHGDQATVAANNPAEDLSLLSPRALHRRLASNAPPAGSSSGSMHHRDGSVASSRQDSAAELPRAPWGSRQGLSSRSSIQRRQLAEYGSLERPVTSSGGTTQPLASSPAAITAVSRAASSRPVTSPSSDAPYIRTERREARDALNLATNPPPSFDQPPPPPRSAARPKRRSKQQSQSQQQQQQPLVPGQKQHVDVYASSSSDEEFTLHAKSFTPPLSHHEIRALDWADGDEAVKVDGAYVAIDASALQVPTIAQALSGSFSPSATGPGKAKSKRRRARAHKAQQLKEGEEQKENDGEPPLPPPSFAPLPAAGSASTAADGAIGEEEEEEGEEEKDDADSPDAASTRERATGAGLSARAQQRRSATASTATTAWAQKLQAAADNRAARAEMARAVAHEESVGGLAAASAQLLSSKAKMAQPSPYQDAILFGDGCRAANATPAAAADAHSNARGSSSSHAHAIVPRPPAAASSSSARTHILGSRKSAAAVEQQLPQARSARARSSSRERVTPAAAASSTRPSTSASALKPSPPSTTRPSTSAAPAPPKQLHVIGGRQAVLEPLQAQPIQRAATAQPSARSVAAAAASSHKKTTASAAAADRARPSTSAAASKPAPAPAAAKSPASSPAASRKKPSSTSPASSASKKKQQTDATSGSAAASSKSSSASQPPPSKSRSRPVPPPLQQPISAPSAPVSTDAYGEDDFDQSEDGELVADDSTGKPAQAAAATEVTTSQPTAAASAATASSSAADDDYAVDDDDFEIGATAPAAPAAPIATAAAAADEEDYAADF